MGRWCAMMPAGGRQLGNPRSAGTPQDKLGNCEFWSRKIQQNL